MTHLPRLLWMLVDGLPHWLVERYAGDPVAALRFPALLRLWSQHRVAPLMPVWPNCQTPPSLSTLWSGLEPLDTGIVGFDLPRPGGPDPIATRPAFSVRPSHVRWIWDHYAEAGHPVRLCHVPFVSPERLGDRAQHVSYGFVPPVRPPRLGPPSQRQRGAWFVDAMADGVQMTSGTWGLEGGDATIELGAWRAERYGEDLAGTAERLLGAAPLVAAAPNKLYRDGRLGPRLDEGGDGSAERAFTATLLQMSSRYFEEFLDAVAQRDSRLVIGYQPAVDIMLHEFAGFLDPACRFWSPEREAVVDALVTRLLDRLDAFLARFEGLVGLGDQALVCSDHGMASLDTLIFPNVVLARKGYLTHSPSQAINAEGSLCFYHPAETGALWINTGAAERAGVSPRTITADLCEGLADAPGGPSEVLPLGGLAGPGFAVVGHLRPGRRQQAKASLGAAAWGPSRKTGEHGSHCDDPRLRGVVIDLCRTGRASGLSPVQAKDVAALFMGARIPQDPVHA